MTFIIGCILLALPLVVITAFMVADSDWKTAGIVWAITLSIVASVYGGCNLIFA